MNFIQMMGYSEYTIASLTVFAATNMLKLSTLKLKSINNDLKLIIKHS